MSLELKDKPIQTIVSTATDSAAPMFFTLDESTRVVFKGEKHVHGFLRTAFEDSQSLELQLTARARQFSSFILLVGKIVEKDQFEPEDAIVLQNKDHVLVRLLTEVIPSAKQFKEAISSLSPEQQRFAQAFRSMQLSSTLFAVCIVQIKPALEKVLNLPSDSLTKEIQLTQDLMKLFIDYQIPSDLLSYDAALQAGPQSVADKVAIVKKNTDEMLKIIEKEKQTQLQGLVENVIGDALLSRDEGFSYEEESIPQTRKTKKSAKVMTAMAFGAPPSATYSSASPSYSPQMPMASAFFSAAPVPQKQMAAIPPPTPQAVPGGSGVRADRASPPDYTHKPELESHAPKYEKLSLLITNSIFLGISILKMKRKEALEIMQRFHCSWTNYSKSLTKRVLFALPSYPPVYGPSSRTLLLYLVRRLTILERKNKNNKSKRHLISSTHSQRAGLLKWTTATCTSSLL